MDIVIRTDASSRIGSGHVTRCLTLANKLKHETATITFVCRDLSGGLSDFIVSKGYAVHRFQLADPERDLPEQIDVKWRDDAEKTISVLSDLKLRPSWLIVDHYGLDKNWETELRPHVDRIMVIDDLANRPHDCDLLLDQNYYLDPDACYENLVPARCRKFLGPRYALLRQEFIEARQHLRERDGVIRRILIFFGGSDPTNETLKAIEGIKSLALDDIQIDVVVGCLNVHKDQIQNACASMRNTRFLCQVDNMAWLMADADLALGAGGSSAWERCLLGLPTVTVVTADNQLRTTVALATSGAIWFLGKSGEISANDFARSIRMVMLDPKRVREISRQALEIMTSFSYGNDDKVLKKILNAPSALRSRSDVFP